MPTLMLRRVAPPREPRRRFSGWTLVVPIVLAACVYVVGTIISDTHWTLRDRSKRTPATVTQPVSWYVTHAGDSWRSVARRTHVPVVTLHRLNPRDTSRGKVVAGERLLLRSGT
jgi:hypothetical protein